VIHEAMHRLAVLSLVLSVLSLEAAKPPLLQQFVIKKPTPQWFGERIKLPPGFAPKMKLRGIEEILFAPGMFKDTEKDFFSYVFLFALGPKPELTADVLRGELLTYYSGLSKNVMRNPKLDTSKFTVKLESLKENGSTPKGAVDVKSYRAQVYWLEPFATKKMQTLHFELQAWKYKGSPYNYLFVCASPQRVEAPIWKTMRGIRASIAIKD